MGTQAPQLENVKGVGVSVDNTQSDYYYYFFLTFKFYSPKIHILCNQPFERAHSLVAFDTFTSSNYF